MTTASTSSLRLLEECLLRNDDHSWHAFLNAHASIWRGLCSEKDWPLWLPGWLVIRGRLGLVRNAVRDKQLEHPEFSEDALLDYLRNYLGRVFRSGLAEYQQEKCSPWSLTDWQWREPPVPADRRVDREKLECLKSWLDQEPTGRRVPFRLRYYRALGPLSPAELAWVATHAGIPQEDLDRRIRDELDTHPRHEYPLGSRFIGGLLRITPALVDQRVRQVMLRLQQRNLAEGQA